MKSNTHNLVWLAAIAGNIILTALYAFEIVTSVVSVGLDSPAIMFDLPVACVVVLSVAALWANRPPLRPTRHKA